MSQPNFDTSNNKVYKIEKIQNSTIYSNKKEGYHQSLYYLAVWNNYFEKKNIWEFFQQFDI